MSNNNMAGTLPSTIGVLTNLQYDVCELFSGVRVGLYAGV